ncbi:hypothetical protein OS493_030141 [Desmophyllum pertusum]|uniref:Uncharacterized protein n=1 Tax=Desmophyllum pertusum TaxID=174260 RepID=A0A9X0CNY5_9CNID|nr:hypothetical protein OS493_030141 [Desmophyllum pertusum]
MSTCFVKKTRQCLEGHFSEAHIEHLVNITLLLQRFMGSSEWYCSKRPMNISSLDPSLRALIPCSDELFTEGHKCTRGFRETFNANRIDPSLCKAFSRARSCTQSVFNRYCNDTIPVPTENRFNPFCSDPGNETTKVAFQASKKSKNATTTATKPKRPTTTSGARRNIRVLSRMLSMAVGVVNLTNVVKSLGLN